MSRRPRLKYPGAVYHVMARGNRKAIIFHDDDDRSMFLEVIAKAVAVYVIRIMAFCLMPNHYHLILETPDANLSEAMQFINGVFAQRSNRRHGLTGHAFEGRFRSLVIQRDSYLMRAARYVVRNPVRAGLADDAACWPWSSYRATAGLADLPPWLDLDWMRLAFDVDSNEAARRQYVSYVNAPADRHTDIDLNATILGSKRFATRVLETLHAEHLQHGHRRQARPSLAELFSGGGSPVVRDRLIYVARVEHGYQLAAIARFLDIDRSTASKAASRGEESTATVAISE